MRTLEAAYLILTSNFRKMKHQGYECTIRKSQVARYVLNALYPSPKLPISSI